MAPRSSTPCTSGLTPPSRGRSSGAERSRSCALSSETSGRTSSSSMTSSPPRSRQTSSARWGSPSRSIDRTALILDIFGVHARTHEGRLQVQLAQLQYVLPRLRGMWSHLVGEQTRGGIGSRFGQGESQLEVDRRLVRSRISTLRRELERLERRRGVQSKARWDSGVWRVALVGYTNAGKSTLLNLLTGADVYAKDELFATLDPTTRSLVLDEGEETDPHRYRRVHPEAPDDARRVLQVDARRGPRRRPRPSCRRRLGPPPRARDRRRARRAGGHRRVRRQERRRPQQVRPPRPGGAARGAGGPPRRRRHLRPDRLGRAGPALQDRRGRRRRAASP